MLSLVADGRILDLWKELGDTVKVPRRSRTTHLANELSTALPAQRPSHGGLC
jgi:hypothetical protein